MPAASSEARVLIVDDEPGFATTAGKIAESAGFEVKLADGPTVFLQAAREWRPLVILMDLRMPGVDGIELLRSLASDHCPANVVLMSGSDAKTLETAMQLGRDRGLNMAGVLPKPLRVQALRDLFDRFRPVPTERLSAEIADAIASEQMFLEYQPKLDVRLRRVTGVEALLRWQHPERGIILPQRFIAAAEETEVISRLTDWVVTTAARQAVAWRADNLDLDIAVNISAMDVVKLDLPDRLEERCRRVGLDPSAMILELTETGAMREPVQMMDVLTRLRLKGFRLSIDDFGTGYSSLIQLQKLPFSELKIDGSFVKEMTTNNGCRIIVEIIIDLARKLGLKSVAEGVEDAAALQALEAMGCDIAQGYYLSRPILADRILPFVVANGAAAKPTA
jgi:EAL domain-containing protein (putative c-di-GMP-specific phosphodiesterase class I)